MFFRSIHVFGLISLISGCTNAVEYGLTDSWDAPGSNGVAIDQEQGEVFTGLGNAVCEAEVDRWGLAMIDSDSGMEEAEVLDAAGGLVLSTDGLTVAVMNPDIYETAEVPVDGQPLDGVFHDDDVVIVTDRCELVFALDGLKVDLPAGACDGELISGDELYWHSSNGHVYSIDKDGSTTDLGVAADVAWSVAQGYWMVAQGTTISARTKDDVVWTYAHKDGIESVFPFGDEVGFRDDNGSLYRLSADGQNAQMLKWIGLGGEIIGSADGRFLAMNRDGLVLIQLAD